VVLDPVAALRSGSVPYWSLFAVQPSARRLATYLEEAAPYEEVLALLFPHGTASIGIAEPDDWRAVLSRARRAGRLLAVDATRFPADFSHLARYGAALSRLRPSLPLPDQPLSLLQLQALAPRLLGDLPPELPDAASV
jgi:hypothetical protein